MSAITLEVPDELAGLLAKYEAQLPGILERAIRSLETGGSSFDPEKYDGSAEIFEFLAGLPAPEEILKLRASDRLQLRLSMLLEKNRNEGLTPPEEEEMDHYERLQHLLGIAKIRAMGKLGLTAEQLNG